MLELNGQFHPSLGEIQKYLRLLRTLAALGKLRTSQCILATLFRITGHSTVPTCLTAAQIRNSVFRPCMADQRSKAKHSGNPNRPQPCTAWLPPFVPASESGNSHGAISAQRMASPFVGGTVPGVGDAVPRSCHRAARPCPLPRQIGVADHVRGMVERL